MKKERKRRLFAATACAAALAVAAVSGTLAFLQDEDSDVNVMTLGNVDIEQIEQQKNAAGELEPFEQGKGLYPGTEISKIVTVKNTGESDAYFRTLIAFEDIDSETFGIKFPIGEFSGYTWSWGTPAAKIELNGVKYQVYEAVYNKALKAGETSPASLTKVDLVATATNEDMAALGETYDILVFSQAVQVAGFEDVGAAAALDKAFGDITDTNHPWANASIVSASSNEELKAAVKDAVAGEDTTIVLEEGDYTTNFTIDGGKNITISGSKDAVLSGQIATTSSTEGTLTLKGVTVKIDDSIVDSTGISQTGKSAIAIWGNQTVICEGVTFDMSLENSTAITSWWDTGKGTSVIVKDCTFNCNGQRPIRATGNVTVENCTFNDPYRYAVQLTAKASTATLLDKAVINFTDNTIVNGASGKDFVYGLQLEGADYGCQDLVINGFDNTIVDGGTDSCMYYCECGKVAHDTIQWNVEVTPVHES